jgi:hypothetical protein
MLAILFLGASVGALSCGGRAKSERVIVVDGGRGGSAGTGGKGVSGGRAAAQGGRPTAGAGGKAGSGGKLALGGQAGEPGMAGAGGESVPESCEATDQNTSGLLQLVTLATSCAAADGDSAFSTFTRDGRYVAFDSDAGDIVPNDLNGKSDAFLFDLETRKLELLSKGYESEDPVEAYAWVGALSDDARYVAFTGGSYSLVRETVPEGWQVYLRDRQTGTTRYFPADYACAYWLDMSGDAAFIVSEGFTNCRGSLDDGDHSSALEHDTRVNTLRHLGTTNDLSDNYRPAISRDGRFVLWGTRPPGTRGEYVSQLRLFDRDNDTTQTLPLYAFHYGSTDISLDGDIVAFASNGQVYRYTRSTDELIQVSQTADEEPGDDSSEEVAMTDDGRYLVFKSRATNLVPDDTNGFADIFLFDATDRSLERVSVANDGTQADEESKYPAIAGNGTRLSFSSKARNLVPAAKAGNFQTYVREIEE